MDQQKRITTVVGIAAVAVIVIVILIMRAPRITKPNGDSLGPDTSGQNSNQPIKNQPSMDTLGIETVKEGTGPAAQNGNAVTVHYTGTLTDGTKFDSSHDRGTPFSFTLGEGNVIQGWEQGVLGMKVGEQRKLTIPSNLGYGDGGYPPVIPPKATLLFDIELLSIK
jgi:FKBP-type peptidyl-prolyl cis-trans isomerase